MTDFAPGIPKARVIRTLPTVRNPRKWDLSLQVHEAKKAGRHLDLRISDPRTQKAHSWALRYWPGVGEVRLAVQQPTHRRSYMGFVGRITGGYGAGAVDVARRESMEVLHADDNHVRFNLYPGQRVEEYLLKRTNGDKWILKNLTQTRERARVPSYKPKYREQDPEKLDPTDRGQVWQPKMSGAHVLVDFRGSRPRVYSYRQGQKLIQHTQKIPGLMTAAVPRSLKGSVFRAELVVPGIPEQRTGGILNSGVWRSREKQGQEGKLRLYVFDVVAWGGKDVESLPYGQKLPMINRATQEVPWLKKPRTYRTTAAKIRLLKRISEGHDKETDEGVVAWNLDGRHPIKAKLRPETDVYVKRVFDEKSTRGMAGGFEYSMSPGGPAVGRVGTGFNHTQKRDMAARPTAYKGLKAKIRMAPGPYRGQKPSFAGWHLDQEIPKTAAFVSGIMKKLTEMSGN